MLTKNEEYTLPAKWASYLINNDTTGYTLGELHEVQYWVKLQRVGSCLLCSDAPTTERYNGLITDCLVYTFDALDVAEIAQG